MEDFISTVLLSLLTALVLILSSESTQHYSGFNTIKPYGHFVILDTHLKADRELHKTLSLTNYNCTKVSSSHLQCSPYTTSPATLANALKLARPIYQTSSKKGSKINVLQGFNGEAHLQVLSSLNGSKNTYSFTSLATLEAFTKRFAHKILPKDLKDSKFELTRLLL